MKRIGFLLITLIALSLASETTHAGWILQQNNNGVATTMYLQNNMAKTVSNPYVSIVNAGSGKVTVLDMAKAKYWTGEPVEYGSALTRRLASLFEKRLHRMPPDKQAEMRLTMGLTKREKPPKVKINDTGESAKIAGYLARHYQLFVDDRLRMDLWLANIPDLLREIDVAKLFVMCGQMVNGADTDWLRSDELKRTLSKGFFLQTITHSMGGRYLYLTSSVKKKRLDKSLFQVPQGLLKVDVTQIIP